MSAPLHPPEPRAGSIASEDDRNPLLEASGLLVESRVPGIVALLAGGSHPAGEAVWVADSGRRISLSDLDLYAILDGEAARRTAEERFRRARPGAAERLGIGLAAPLEVAFLTAAGLARLPARPGTLALRRSGRVLRGAPGWLERVPAYGPQDVGAEEIALLVENRSFELLDAWPDRAASDRLARLKARHAVLKTALDLARAAALSAGELPARARDLPSWWRAHAGGGGAELESLLTTAVAWREIGASDAPAEILRQEWNTAASCWVRAWRALGPGEEDPERLVLARARRARLRRRVRQALRHPARSGRGPELGGRLLHALAGTPQHRVNASAAALLLAATEPARSPQASAARVATAGSPGAGLPAWAVRALGVLGVVDAPDRADWARAARQVVRAWDCWVLDGQRTGETS